MRILFVTKNFVIEPLGIMYLMSALKNAGHQPDIIQTDREDIDVYIRNFKPSVIAYSLITGTHGYFQNLNRELKKKYHFLSLFGGAHVTFFADDLMKDGAVDVACIGEGEEALVELADAIEQGKPYHEIKNLWVRLGGHIYKNDVRQLRALDAIAFPERELIYRKYGDCRLNPIKNIIATRGCPFNCSYCYNNQIKALYADKGAYVRQRSINNVFAELVEIKKKYPLDLFYFQDDIFAYNKDWLKDFARRYPAEIGMRFHCHLRVGLADQETVSLLATAGCTSVSFGVEAGNDRIRKEVLGRKMSREQILELAKMLREANIKFRTLNMVGLPGGSIATDLETLELNIRCRPDLGWAGIFQPYPKTDLYHKAKDLNLCGEIELSKFDTFFGDSVLNLPDKKKIINLQRLFSFIVSWPILFPLTEFLIGLPFNRFYSKIHDGWKKHCNDKIYRIGSAKKNGASANSS